MECFLTGMIRQWKPDDLLSFGAAESKGAPSPEITTFVDDWTLQRANQDGWIQLSTGGEQVLKGKFILVMQPSISSCFTPQLFILRLPGKNYEPGNYWQQDARCYDFSTDNPHSSNCFLVYLSKDNQTPDNISFVTLFFPGAIERFPVDVLRSVAYCQ
jgi:hypothetical protein